MDSHDFGSLFTLTFTLNDYYKSNVNLAVFKERQSEKLPKPVNFISTPSKKDSNSSKLAGLLDYLGIFGCFCYLLSKVILGSFWKNFIHNYLYMNQLEADFEDEQLLAVAQGNLETERSELSGFETARSAVSSNQLVTEES